ncbi:hypothetical protein AK830_g10245 [Neonectria ditissima]|uniref:Uncharacterized protein n=1 Tax=Neonectria ditissima TaxID=78410 RepID=A0A0P7AQD7_9HYPO|nr:hypothetical protein AK830_g10245 [Neonectria ditissima]
MPVGSAKAATAPEPHDCLRRQVMPRRRGENSMSRDRVSVLMAELTRTAINPGARRWGLSCQSAPFG